MPQDSQWVAQTIDRIDASSRSEDTHLIELDLTPWLGALVWVL